MDRREAVKRVALMMGGVVFMPSVLGTLKGCSPRAGVKWTPIAFSAEEAPFVEQLAETLIPRTDTPGALDAGVPSFIDTMVSEVYREEDREMFLKRMREFISETEVRLGSSFTELDAEQKLRYIEEVDKETYEQPRDDFPSFYHMFKEMTLLGYGSSEQGATQHLRFMMNYGDYKGCIPFEEVGRTWAGFR